MTNYILGRSPTGIVTFQDTDSGEFLHRYFGPLHESRTLYVEGCGLNLAQGPIKVCDLGMGCGFNVLATVEWAQGSQKISNLHIQSFDTTAHGLKKLLDHLDEFPEYQKWAHLLQEAVASTAALETSCRVHWILDNGVPLTWEIFIGEAFTVLPLLSSESGFDAIFYDLFSCQKTGAFWLRPAFESLTKRLNPSGVLATYSTATAVRAILLSLGCTVGEGPLVTSAIRSTLASPDPTRILNPLDRRWLSRFCNSPKQTFDAEADGNQMIIRNSVPKHPQFLLNHCGEDCHAL